MQKLFRNTGTTIIGAIIFLVIISFGVQVQAVAPDNVKIMLNHRYKTYSAPACLNPNLKYNTADYEVSTLGKARALKYEPDSICTEEEIFPARSLFSHYILEKLGIVKPLKKWNDDGTWNL